MLSFIYSGSGRVLFRLKFLTSAMIHLAPGLEMKLLKRNFVVVTVAVGVLNSPAKSRRFPPTVSRVR